MKNCGGIPVIKDNSEVVLTIDGVKYNLNPTKEGLERIKEIVALAEKAKKYKPLVKKKRVPKDCTSRLILSALSGISCSNKEEKAKAFNYGKVTHLIQTYIQKEIM